MKSQSQSKEIKSSIMLLVSFFVSVIILIAFYLAFFLATDAIQKYVPLTGGFLAVWGPPSIICIIVSLLFLIPIRLLKANKKIIPIGFALLAVYAVVIFGIVVFKYTGVERESFLSILKIYLILPAIWGNLINWVGYFFFTRNSK